MTPALASAGVGPARSEATPARTTATVGGTARTTGHSLPWRTSHTSAAIFAGVPAVTGALALPPPDPVDTTMLETPNGESDEPDTTVAPELPQAAASRHVPARTSGRRVMVSPLCGRVWRAGAG